MSFINEISEYPSLREPCGTYQEPETEYQFFIRNQAPVRAMFPEDFNNIRNLDENSHIAALRRGRNKVADAIQDKADQAVKNKIEWGETEETAYRGCLALVKSLDDLIKKKEGSSATENSRTKRGGGLIFSKNQPITNTRANPYHGVGVGDILKALITGDKGNQQIQNALAEGQSASGGYTVPSVLLPSFIDLIRAKSVLNQAGAVTVMLNTHQTSMAKVLTDPVPAWRAENAPVSESDMTFGSIVFQPQSLAVLVKVSRELIQDSINIETILADCMASAIAAQLDYAGLYGSGLGNQPTGLKSVLVANNRFSAVAENGKKLGEAGFYRPIMTAASKVGASNDQANAAIMSSRTLYDCLDFVDLNYQPLQRPGWISTNLQLLDTNAIPNNLVSGTSAAVCSEAFVGNFQNLMLGMRQELHVEIIRDAFASNLQVGFLASLRADWQVARPSSFWIVQGILPE